MMTQEAALEQLTQIFRSVLNEPTLELQADSSQDDVAAWDSLSNVMLVVEIESAFKKRFKARQIEQWKRVQDILDSILGG